jgi:hypothetical protein
LTEKAFWKLTPRKLEALLERHTERLKQDDLRAGIIASLLFNSSYGHTAVKSPADFFPRLVEVAPAASASSTELPDWRKLLNHIEQANVALGGRDERVHLSVLHGSKSA